MRLRAAFHIKAGFIPKGPPAGFPSDAAIPHNKLPPQKGSKAASSATFQAELRKGGSRPGWGRGAHGCLAYRSCPQPSRVPGSEPPAVLWCPTHLRGASEEGLRLSLLSPD